MKNQVPLKVDYGFIEALGKLASASENKDHKKRFIHDKGLVKAIETLEKLGMVDSEQGKKGFRLNDRGREYAMFVLTAACEISNRGIYQPRYSKSKRDCALGVIVDTFNPSYSKIEIKG